MEFRLVYEGRLLGASKADTRAEHKHEIRRVFHAQLKRLWESTPHLREWIFREVSWSGHEIPTTENYYNPRYVGQTNAQKEISGKTVIGYSQLETLADKFSLKGFRFAPLATRDLELVCGLDVLFLRYDDPKSNPMLKSGDIDNRLKTIFDALQKPDVNQIDPRWAVPQDGEDPFFCLLEEDCLINRVAVTTDLLLKPNVDLNDAQVVITVSLRPSAFNWNNMNFGI